MWLAPVQLAILPLNDRHVAMAEHVAAAARDRDLRVDVISPSASLGARVRRAQERKVPFMGIVGDREVADDTVALRSRHGVRQALPSAEVVERLAILAAQRGAGLDL